jgi:hypothetical protein
MIVEETFYRPPELAREARTLPAATYNLAHALLARATRGSVFVPIRAMQFLAVVDAQEFIFVDREGRRLIEIAWHAFRPQLRSALADPVPYEAIYYSPTAAQTMQRLQGEFYRALVALKHRADVGVTARSVVKIDRVKS